MNLDWRSNGEATQFGHESIKLQISTNHSGVVQSKGSLLDIDEKVFMQRVGEGGGGFCKRITVKVMMELGDGGVVEGYNNGDDSGVQIDSDGDDCWVDGRVDDYLAGSRINLGPYQMMMDLAMSCAVVIYFDDDGGP
ncbi:hypothetical protein MRB53_005347 [Persea americana]|uniref:Uncharacterized protein n=1 Tax=Persea americana TaxID=3435 RepID=A0ACC2MD14_PERAE|nr:hypothetical protein MRB53_005347 [Persea americana]